jgi:hypothetical protein
MAKIESDTRVTIGDQTYEILLEQDDGGGDYEWGMAALLRSPDGQLFLVTDGGCSCYGPWENVVRDDVVPVPSWQAAVDVAKTKGVYLFGDDDIAKFAQRLMELRPAPSKG